MFPYLSVFLLSSALLAFADKVKKSQRLVFVALALLLPSLLAGYRADFIGTDTEVYLMPTIRAAMDARSFGDYLESSWFRIWRYLYVGSFELGFTSVVYITTKVLGPIWAKVIIQMLIVAPVYFSIKKYGKYPSWLGMLVFYLTTYNSTLNLIRQSIAMSFVLLGTIYFLEKSKRGFLASLLVAISFHRTGVVLIVIALLINFVKSNSSYNDKGVIASELRKTWLVVGIAIAALFSLTYVIQILRLVGLSSYTNYLGEGFRFVMNQSVLRLPILLLIFCNWRKWNQNERNARIFLLMFILTLLCWQLTSVNIYSGRISYYFSSIEVLSYPSLCYTLVNKNNRFLMIVCLLVFLFAYWWIFYVYYGIDATFPYVIL